MDLGMQLQIEALCTRTVNHYAIAVGERDHQGFAELFTEDGVWQRPGQKAMSGRAEIKAFMDRVEPDTLIRHVNGSIRVDVVDLDNARVISNTTVYNCEKYVEGIAPMGGPDYVVEYRDIMRRVGSQFLIARRDTRVVFRADYAAGLPGLPSTRKA